MTYTMHIGEFKERFSEVVEMLKQGIVVKVIKGKSGELVGYFGKEPIQITKPVRNLGFLNPGTEMISIDKLRWTDDELNSLGL